MQLTIGIEQVFDNRFLSCSVFFFFKQKTAYEMRISDWSSDVCSSDLHSHQNSHTFYLRYQGPLPAENDVKVDVTINEVLCFPLQNRTIHRTYAGFDDLPEGPTIKVYAIEEVVIEKLLALSNQARNRSEEHTSELQSLMRISYAVFCLKKKKNK